MTRRWVLLLGAALLATIPLAVSDVARAGHDDCTVAESGDHPHLAKGDRRSHPFQR